MNPRRRLLVSVASVLSLAVACGKGPPRAAAPPPVPVRAAVVETRDVPLEVSAIGRVEAYATVSLRPLVGGTVTRVAFREGQDVREGDLLFQIDARPYQAAADQARANLERDRAQSREADANLARYADLVAKDYVTKEQFSQAQANADALRAAVKADEAALEAARLNLAHCTVQAPTGGRTGSVLVDAGNVVAPSDARPLVVLNQVEPVRVAFSVPERALPEIKKRMAGAKLVALAAPDAPGAAASSGELTFVDNSVDATTGTISLKATFPNRDRKLWPGQFVNVTLTLAVETAVVAPSSAILPGQKGAYAYVLGTGDVAEARPVVVARTYRDLSVLASGLEPGERVVTDGQLRLAPGVKASVRSDAAEAPATVTAPAAAGRKS